MTRRIILQGLLAAVSGCGVIRPDSSGGAAAMSAGEGLGVGPIDEAPTDGAFGPWSVSHSPKVSRDH